MGVGGGSLHEGSFGDVVGDGKEALVLEVELVDLADDRDVPVLLGFQALPPSWQHFINQQWIQTHVNYHPNLLLELVEVTFAIFAYYRDLDNKRSNSKVGKHIQYRFSCQISGWARIPYFISGNKIRIILDQTNLDRNYTPMENRPPPCQPSIRRIVSKYQLSDLLGTGSYSQVFKARHLETPSKTFAVKVVSNKLLADNAKVKQCMSNQLVIHSQLEPCPYIVQFYELLQTRNNCYFVYEYCEGGTLLDLIKREKTLQERRAIEIFSQLIEGLKVLRKHNIMHRDLKPENVLIKEGIFKLADFGFCKELGGDHMTKTMLGSPLYMAPQVLRGESYSVNADVWSMGVILYEMLYGHCPFESNSIAALITTIDETCLTFDSSISISINVRNLITKCLQKDTKKRLKWDQLFDQVGKVLERQAESLPGGVIKNPRRQIAKSNTLRIDISMDHSPSFKKRQNPSTSKSKYEIFKDNYNKINNETTYFTNTLDLSKNDKSRTIIIKNSDFHEKEKQAKICFNEIIAQHQSCVQILRLILNTLQSKERSVYPHVCSMLSKVRTVLQKIYSRINLDDSEMLPALSVVKYEIIQIDKIAAETQKVLPLQVSKDIENACMPRSLMQEWSHFLQTCCN